MGSNAPVRIGLFVALFAVAFSAEARSAGGGGHAAGGHSGGGFHGSSPVHGAPGFHASQGFSSNYHGAVTPTGPYHAAVPVGQPGYTYRPYGYGGGVSVGYGYAYGYPSCGWGCWPYRFGWGFGYAPFWWSAPYVEQRPTVEYAPREEAPWRVTLGVQGQALRSGGGALGGNFAVEKNRFGFETQFTALASPTNDGTGGTNTTKLLNMNLTFAPIANEHGRLRLGIGLDSAFVPGVVMMGPGLTAGAVIGLIGPIGIEGNVNITPWPFTQLDWNAGATLALGPVGLRAGWRRIWMNDNGVVNGTAQTSIFDGPYGAVGFVF